MILSLTPGCRQTKSVRERAASSSPSEAASTFVNWRRGAGHVPEAGRRKNLRAFSRSFQTFSFFIAKAWPQKERFLIVLIALTVLRHSLICCCEFPSRLPWPCLWDRPHRVRGLGSDLVPGGGALEWLPRLVGRSRALEIVLSGNDFDADIAERYGWVNRTLDDDDLDSFVDALAQRVASFHRETLAAAKAQVNRFGTPTATELKSSIDLFFPLLALPGAQARRAKVRNIGYGVPSDFELNFGRYLPSFGQADDDATGQKR